MSLGAPLYDTILMRPMQAAAGLINHQTGFYQALQFQSSLFKPTFNNHMATLQKIKSGNKSGYHALMSTVYDVARSVLSVFHHSFLQV